MRHASPRSELAESAREFERAGRAIRARAPEDPEANLLAHIAEALSSLDHALLATASRLVNRVDAGTCGGEAEALRWHLVETARRSRAAAASCHEAKRWALACVSGSRRAAAFAGD